MTTQKPELMPDEINVCVDTMQIKDFENKYTTSYTRTDLYTAVVAERDALRALCEGMAGALKNIAKRPDLPNPERDADWKNCMKWNAREAAQALAAYEKHKGVG